MNRDQALRKVLACLRLSASNNAHEAAAALRQARALMDKYGLTDADAEASEIRSADAPTRANGAMLTPSLAILANLVARGYRCDVVVRPERKLSGDFVVRGRTLVSFFGAGADAQVAAYAFTVLRRQMEADKARHTRRIRKRANKQARGEAFALGWVVAVRDLFPRAELTDERARVIRHAMSQQLGATERTPAREVATRGRNTQDEYAGFRAGSDARLHSGVTENAQLRLGKS